MFEVLVSKPTPLSTTNARLLGQRVRSMNMSTYTALRKIIPYAQNPKMLTELGFRVQSVRRDDTECCNILQNQGAEIKPSAVAPSRDSFDKFKVNHEISNPIAKSNTVEVSHSISMELLGQILLRKRYISPTQLETAIALQIKCSLKLGELLIQQGLLHPFQLEDALKEQKWRRDGFWVI